MTTVILHGGEEYTEDSESDYYVTVKDYGVLVYEISTKERRIYPWHRISMVYEKNGDD